MKKNDNVSIISRRDFCTGVLVGSAALSALPAKAGEVAPKKSVDRKIKIGIVGLGHRGNLVGDFCRAHGGYEIAAVADYFENTAQQHGQRLGVPQDKIFSGLSGYKRILDSGVEALLVMDVPYFYPEQAAAAVDAGCSVYIAKPVAVDIPGVQAIEAAAKKATEKKLCFLVDYQLTTDSANAEVAKRISEGGLGAMAHIYSGGTGGPWPDPKQGTTIENLLHQGWLSRIALCGDDIVSYDIHIIDGISWVMKKEPVSASGLSGVFRKRNGDTTDAGGVVFQYEDGIIWTHITQALKNNSTLHDLSADFMGVSATAHLGYWGKVYVRGGSKHYSGSASKSIYNDGIKVNVAEFYRCITEGDFANPTAKRAVDGTITAILGREAMARKSLVTRDELIRENKKLTANLKGLKA